VVIKAFFSMEENAFLYGIKTIESIGQSEDV
jgi:hypothetical protein